MSFDSHQTDKLSIFIDDMRRLDVAIAPPSVNDSEADFSVGRSDEGLAVRYALGALKGVGEKAMEALVAERAKGDFVSLDDFASRIDPKMLNRSEEHTSELQSLMRISYAVFCLKKKTTRQNNTTLTYST